MSSRAKALEGEVIQPGEGQAASYSVDDLRGYLAEPIPMTLAADSADEYAASLDSYCDYVRERLRMIFGLAWDFMLTDKVIGTTEVLVLGRLAVAFGNREHSFHDEWGGTARSGSATEAIQTASKQAFLACARSLGMPIPMRQYQKAAEPAEQPAPKDRSEALKIIGHEMERIYPQDVESAKALRAALLNGKQIRAATDVELIQFVAELRRIKSREDAERIVNGEVRR